MAASVALLALLFVCAFLLGSIPWGVIISRLAYHTDIREVGSGNIGATNAVRALGAKGGGVVFALDVAKGAVAGALGRLLWPLFIAPGSLDVPDVALLCGSVAFAGCVWGHIFCPWLGFKGGKGISVAVGCEIFTLGPVGVGALSELAVFLIFAATTRYVSLGSIMAAVALPFIALGLMWGNWLAIIITSAVALTAIWAHRANVGRLVAGTERRFSFRKES